MKEKKARVEDAMHATRAAVEEGIVPGGGVALVRCAAAVDDVIKARGRREDRRNIIRRALEEPLRMIVSQRRRRRRGRRRQDPRIEGQPTSATTPQTGDLRGPGQGRRHRPDQGHAHCAAERSFHRRPDADHRSHDLRNSGEEGSSGRRRTRRRHGRHVLKPAVND